MAKRKITKRTVDALKSGELVWDTDVKGFGVRRQREAWVFFGQVSLWEPAAMVSDRRACFAVYGGKGAPKGKGCLR
jgi:hypothetical protein